MSSSPLNFFRTNQKIFFAVLTVVVMFMFVLSFGQGDFFSRLPRWLNSGKGETVATLDGSKVTTADLSKVNQGRNWANKAMKLAMFTAMNKVGEFIDKNKSKASDELKPQIDNFLSTRQNKPNVMNASGGTIPGTAYLTFQQFFQLIQNQITPQQIPQLQDQTISQLTFQMQAAANNPTSKADDQELAKACLSMINLDVQAMFGSSAFFETIIADGKTASAMEFELWKRKAEKMGVYFTERDTVSICMSEFYGQLTETEWNTVEAELAKEFRDQNFTRTRLREALADELKVRMAMTSILGPVGVKSGDNDFSRGTAFISAPYEEFKYFQKQCNQSEYGLISVPVANYISKVQGEPTKQEMDDLFKKYRSEEPNPLRELPGFKEPRKLKLQWLEVKGDEAYFKKMAAESLPKLELQAKLNGFFVAPVGGAITTLLAAPAALGTTSLAFQAAYSEYARKTRDSEDSTWYPMFGATLNRISDENLVRPANLAAASAGAAGALLTQGSPFTAAVSMQAAATITERDARARAAAYMFLPPLPGAVAPLAGIGPMFAKGPKPLSLPVIGDSLQKEVATRLARTIAFDDMTMFREKLTELGKTKDKAPAIDYIEQFVKARGLKLGASKEFRDQFSMGEDEGLKPLKDRNLSLNLGSPVPPLFGPQFFGTRNPNTGQDFVFTVLYSPTPFPNQVDQNTFVGTPGTPPTDDSAYMVWRTDDLPAETPKAIDGKTKEKIVNAWKRMKARELAKAEADEMAKKAGTFGNSPVVIRQKLFDLQTELQKAFAKPEEKEKVKYIAKTNVAEFVTSEGFLTPGRAPISRFFVEPSSDILYPNIQTMTKDLLDNRDKPLSTAFVMADRPKDHFYVSVLISRDEKSLLDYSMNVFSPIDPRGYGPVVRQQFSGEHRMKVREQALDLIKAELKYDKENEKLLKDKSEE